MNKLWDYINEKSMSNIVFYKVTRVREKQGDEEALLCLIKCLSEANESLVSDLIKHAQVCANYGRIIP